MCEKNMMGLSPVTRNLYYLAYTAFLLWETGKNGHILHYSPPPQKKNKTKQKQNKTKTKTNNKKTF